MKKETIKNFLLLLICLAGGLLIGFNAGRLDSGLHAVLFVLGLVMISMSVVLMGLLQTLGKKKEK